MENKKILITGFGGSIGSELTRQLSVDNEIWGIDNNETALFDLLEELKQQGRNVHAVVGDIRDKEIFYEIPGDIEYIFHAGALKHVTPSQWTPMEYVKTNINGTYNVLDFAFKCQAKMINISTDKVVNANSIMGATKKVSEIMVKNANQISVRFGNVMGSRGSVISIWQKQMDEGKPLTITDEKMERYMMTIPQAVSLVIEASQMENVEGRIIILDMGKPVSILKLAEDILEKSKSQVGTKIIGSRPGETLDEKLMTDDEAKIAEKRDNFFII